MARDLKNKLGFVGFDSPTHTSAGAVTSSAKTRAEPRAAAPSQSSQQSSLTRMKDELFGGSSAGMNVLNVVHQEVYSIVFCVCDLGTGKSRVDSSPPPPEPARYDSTRTETSNIPTQETVTSGDQDEESEEEDRSGIL